MVYRRRSEFFYAHTSAIGTSPGAPSDTGGGSKSFRQAPKPSLFHSDGRTFFAEMELGSGGSTRLLASPAARLFSGGDKASTNPLTAEQVQTAHLYFERPL